MKQRAEERNSEGLGVQEQLWRTAQGWMILGQNQQGDGTTFSGLKPEKMTTQTKNSCGQAMCNRLSHGLREVGAHDCPQK